MSSGWVADYGEVFTEDGEYVGEIRQINPPGWWWAIPGQRPATFAPGRRVLPEQVFRSSEAARAYLIDAEATPPRSQRLRS